MKRKMQTLGSILSILCLLVMAAPAAMAADYPSHTITVLVPFGAGGAADMHSRLLQPALKKRLGVNIVVKNVGGGAGTIGAAQAAASKPDGYTILYSPIAPICVQPHLRNIPYSYDSFEPVARVSNPPVVLMASKDFAFKDVASFIVDAKKNPNKYIYDSVGAGSIPHVAMAGFCNKAGIKMKHLPFRDGGEMMKALLGNQVDVGVELPHLATRYGLRVMAVFADEKYHLFPEAPTMKELGFDFSYALWMGFFAPKNTPADRIAKFRKAVSDSLKDKEILDKFKQQHVDLGYMEGQEFVDFVKNCYLENEKILIATGLKK